MNSKLSILLVDDDLVDQEAIRRAIGAAGIDNPLVVANDGQQALAILRGDAQPPLPRPHLVLLDLNMPKMNGIEFLDELRSDPRLRSCVVFVLSTSNNPEDIEQSYERQVAGYICKSTLPQDLSALTDFLSCYGQLVALPA